MPDRGFRSGHHGIAGGHLFQISGDEHSPSLAPVKQRLRTGEIRCGIGPATSTSTPLTRSQCRFTAQIASEAPRRNRSDPTPVADRKSTRLNSSHGYISYAVFCLKKKKK